MSQAEIKTQKFIVKFFPEIMIKGNRAKKQMINQLFANLQKLMEKIDKKVKLKKLFDRIEIITPINIVLEVRLKLIQTSGIELVLEVLQFNNISTINDIKTIVNEKINEKIRGKTFVVRAKRTGIHDFNSVDIEKAVGGYMLAHNKTRGVNLKNAEVTIDIELVNKQLNIITNIHKGLSGFPLGTQGEVLSLISGGFDSTVASYLMMKKGIKTHFIFFNLGGVAHEIGVKQVVLYLWNKYGSCAEVSFISIPFDDVVSEIFKSICQPYMGIMLKRLMLMASEKIADEMGIDTLITGESIAQVSSQTLKNLALINQATSKLVLRPLATINKREIIDLSCKIGTKRFAENMPEYCGVISKKPVVYGSFNEIKKEVAKFDYNILNKAVKNSIKINVDEIEENINKIGEIEVVNDLSNTQYTIVDIRQGEDCIKTPCKTIKIPFYNLKNEFKKLPQNKEYLFYCDKGILSQLHAQYLRDGQNYTNIKVYRPK